MHNWLGESQISSRRGQYQERSFPYKLRPISKGVLTIFYISQCLLLHIRIPTTPDFSCYECMTIHSNVSINPENTLTWVQSWTKSSWTALTFADACRIAIWQVGMCLWNTFFIKTKYKFSTQHFALILKCRDCSSHN